MLCALEVCAVPENGKIYVRFLEAPRGIVTHWRKRKSYACPGEEKCHAHEFGIWKGYAPAQVWSVLKKVWLPVVLEVTEGLQSILGPRHIRGSYWELYREKTRYGKHTVAGKSLDIFEACDLPGAFCVEKTVERLYRTNAIAWDIPPVDFLRETAESAEGPCPVPIDTPLSKSVNTETRSARDAFQRSKQTARATGHKFNGDPSQFANGIGGGK